MSNTRTFVAFLALLALLGSLAAEFYALRLPRPLRLPPQAQVQTTNPKIGVHTRLTGIGDEALIERTLRQVREMGASWITELFPWAYIQPRSRYGYDWNGSDMVMQHAARQGLQVVARLDLVPQWARPATSNDRYLDASHYADFADFAAAFMLRYRRLGVRHIIIWNEPNLAFEWGQRRPDPLAYAALLKVVYPRVKAAVPDTVVLLAGLSPGPDLGDGAVRLNDLQYLEDVYTAGAAPFFDGLAVHTYGAQLPPAAPANPAVVNFRRVEVLRTRLVAHGDQHKPLIITEGGWNDSPRWSAAVLPAQRVRWTVEAYQMASTWEWLDAMCLWQFSLPQPARTYQDYWTFVAPDGTPKAIYLAVQAAFRP